MNPVGSAGDNNQMKNLIKKAMQFFWHHSQAYTLITLPVNGLSVCISLFTMMAVVFNLRFPIWGYGLFFIAATLLITLLGVIAKKAGFLSYWQELNNSQNPELLEILREVRSLKEGVEKNI